MLAYFPVAYPDELLYSLIARYAIHTGQLENQKAVLKDIFGSPSAVAIPDLPSHLNSFRRRVAQIWQCTTIEIIKRHTLAPIYLPFLRPKQAKLIIKSMSSDYGGNIHTRCGLTASSVPQPIFFRYCPLCVEAQYKHWGEPYWQRSHQLPGIGICNQHQCKLVASTQPFHPKEKHLYQTAAKECVEKSVQSVTLSEIENRLVGHYRELLELQTVNGHTAHQWSMFYRDLAGESGFKQGSKVDHHAIRRHLNKDWSRTNFQFNLEQGSDNDWLVSLFRKHRKTFHPIRHLLVWSSLLPNATTKEIFNFVGKLPKEPVIIAGTFVKKVVSDKILIQEKRNAWLYLLQDCTNTGIKAIRARVPGGALYAWLYRFDREWLMDHRPPVARQQGHFRTADYKNWDMANLHALMQILTDNVGYSNRPRLSQTFFIKQLPRANSVVKHLQDLPETSNWLINNAESIEQYQLFRIRKAVEALKLQNLPVIRWRLLRTAGIRYESVTSKIEELIGDLEN